MIGAVVFLAASIAIERSNVDCWQTSISAYYYTPVRAIFVGSMIAVGLSLIVYKARFMLEDVLLNLAGMLAPVVAVAPTTDVGKCWSVTPNPLPVSNGAPANWVVKNIDNNFYALLIAGAVGLIVGVAIALITTIARRKSISESVEEVEQGTGYSLAACAVALLAGWALIRYWSDFDTRAHGFAAVGMFVSLIASIIVKLWHQRGEPADQPLSWKPGWTRLAARSGHWGDPRGSLGHHSAGRGSLARARVDALPSTVAPPTGSPGLR